MGSPVCVVVAEIVMQSIEERALATRQTLPLVSLRRRHYRDLKIWRREAWRRRQEIRINVTHAYSTHIKRCINVAQWARTANSRIWRPPGDASILPHFHWYLEKNGNWQMISDFAWAILTDINCRLKTLELVSSLSCNVHCRTMAISSGKPM